MKKALVLAGGIAQAALIRELKSRGYETLLADMNPNCFCAGLADAFFPISAMDYEGLEKLARREQVDMVLTACADQILLAETWLNERLGLRSYISHETAKLVSDKKRMKEIFLRSGIPTSRYVVLDAYCEESLARLRYPLIVKPVDAYSSRGVERCRDREELQRFLPEAVRISRSGAAIAEEYLEGQELTVEVFVREGKAQLLCCGSKEKLKNTGFVSYGSVYPSRLSDAVQRKIAEVAQQIADAFHLVNSPMLIQFIVQDEQPYVLEFCARTGGFIKYEIVRRMSGFDPIKAAVDLHEGIVPAVSEVKPEKNYLVSCFLYCSEGVVDSFCGFEELQREGVISRYWLARPRGFSFAGIKSNGDRAACYIIQDDSYEGLMEKYALARSRVKILDREGRNLIRFDLM